MKLEFSTLDVCRIFNIPLRRLREWLERDYIKPSIEKARGRGTKTLFSHEDLEVIGIFVNLVDSGVERLEACSTAYGIMRSPRLSAENCVILETSIMRHVTAVNARSGREDKKKRVVVSRSLRKAQESINLKEVPDSLGAWDSLFILNLAKIRKDIKVAIINQIK